MISFFNKHKKLRSSVTYVGIFLFIFVQIFGYLLTPGVVHAMPVTAADVTGAVTGQTVNETVTENKKNVAKEVGNALLSSLLGALMQGVSYFTRKLAYDTASYIASGGVGQGSTVFEEGPGKYFENVAGDALATTIEELGQPFGFGLCKPPNVNIQAYLSIGIPGLFPEGGAEPKPSCQWSQLKNNWENWDLIKDPLDALGLKADSPEEFFQKTLRVSQSDDFSIGFGAVAQVDRARVEAKEEAKIKRIEGQGFKAVTDLISGNIKTPGQVVLEESKALTSNNQTQLTAQQIAGIYGAGFYQIIPTTISVFLNGLVTGVLGNLFSGGYGITGGSYEEVDASNYSGGPGGARRQAAQRAFAFLLATPAIQTDSIDILGQYAACGQYPGLNNCVMDNGMYDAFLRSQQGQEFMTIREAMDEGMLHADWPLISYLDVGRNGNIQACVNGAYCYSNIQKMRRIGLLPLGFEIAAARSDITNPVTLGQVVNGFEDCARDALGNVINGDDPNFPFCHLIDPNWVLKAPVARCEAFVFGPQLLSPDTDARGQECADISTCVSFNEDGTCAHYGYCTRTEKAWNIPGEKCEAHEATCTYYTNTENNKKAAYLSRSVDYGTCNADTVGCRAYSTEQLSQTTWTTSIEAANDDLPLGTLAAYQAAGRNPTIHFNGVVTGNTCPEGSAGCRALIIGSEVDDGNPTRRTFEYARDGAGNKEILNMQVAPPMLGCYDTDPSTPSIEYPRTKAELALITGDSESCSDYSTICVEEEVGCESHLPVNGGSAVPGIVGANACAQECVGYETFTQLESEFERERDPLYFIPQNAQTCQAQYVGCSEFTNLDELARGGESREYYSEIKYCEKPLDPDRANEKTFYSWEGSAQQGFVIKVHKLKFVNDTNDVDLLEVLVRGTRAEVLGVVGSPMYAQRTQEELLENYDKCNASNYQALVNGDPNPADPDCREFFDDEQNFYYRLLSDTVTVSDQCVPLRISRPDLFIDENIIDEDICLGANGFFNNGSCERCRGGGFYDRGECVYNSIISEAQRCPAAANECRAYEGNFAGNVQQIFNLDFELPNSTASATLAVLEGWTGAALSSESLQLGGTSLAPNGSISNFGLMYDIRDYDITQEDVNEYVYKLSFWAKSNQPTNVSIYWDSAIYGVTFSQQGTAIENYQQSIGTEWQEYVLYAQRVDFYYQELGYDIGTVPEIAAQDPTAIHFTGSNNQFYIDNFTLTRITDTAYLIKDSWKVDQDGILRDVPAACDSDPLDAFPGEALGCQAYTAQNTQTEVYATGFEQLCRPEAVGCYAFYDTYNTVEETATVYQAWCDATTCDCPSGIPGTCSISYAGEVLGSCEARLGQSGCYIDKITYPADVVLTEAFVASQPYITESSIVLPADTPENQPIFLAAQEQWLCSGLSLGCTPVGLEEQLVPSDASSAFNFVETYLINDPAQYAETLCTGEQLGCSAFRSSDSLSYFKDPTVIGSPLCTYRENDGSGVQAGTGGWFFEDIGACGGNPDFLCRDDSQCTGGTTCQNIGNVQCYPGSIDRNGNAELLSNGNPNYLGYVGVCDPEADQCTEFIDRADKDLQHPGGTPHYVIFDETIENRIGECQGQASLREGCVLFDQTDNPTKLYDTLSTYADSENEINLRGGDGLVVPRTGPTKDSNIILKVDRDIQCSEWLSCRNQVVYRDESGNPITLCYDYETCVEADGTKCTQFVESQGAFSQQRLSKDIYARRDTSWYGDDYSGYSLFERYPVADLGYTQVPDISDPDTTFLGYTTPQQFLTTSNDCLTATGVESNWSACGPDSAGKCIEGYCMYPLVGNFPSGFNGSNFVQTPNKYLEPNTCKGFPEETSPFPQSILAGAPRVLRSDDGNITLERSIFEQKKNDFVNANVCQDDKCSCAYKKITQFDNSVDYWRATTANPPSAVCTGGNDGIPCIYDPGSPSGPGLNGECIENENLSGVCRPARQVENRLGTFGYCLEYDYSRPINGGASDQAFACLTWLPLEVSASRLDTFNQRTEAGYYPVGIYDAPNGGGQVYCTDSSARGGGLYDNSNYRKVGTANSVNDLRFTNFGIWNNTEQTLNRFFEFDSQSINYSFPKLVSNECQRELTRPAGGDSDVNYGDGGIISDSYNDIVCFSGGRRPSDQTFGSSENSRASGQLDFTTMLQNWAYAFLGSNAVLLRAEKIDRPINNRWGISLAYFREWGYWNSRESGDSAWDCNPRENNDAEHGCNVYALLPHTLGDSDVMMHPPKNFNRDNQASKEMSKTIAFTNDVADGLPGNYQSNDPIRIFTDFHSATAGNLSTVDGASIDDLLYVSPVQEGLNEDIVERIYLLPISFPGGSHKRLSPRILDRELYINISGLSDKLDSNVAPAVESRVGMFTRQQTHNPTNGTDPYIYNDEFPDNWIRRQDMTWYTYALERTGEGECDGLQSYCTYTDNGYDYTGSITNYGSDPRQVIHRRYVGVFYSANNTANQFITQFPPNSVETDPFRAPCVDPQGETYATWYAIGLDFNIDGEFLGYISRHCGSFRFSGVHPSSAGAIQMAVIGQLKDQCTGFASVYDSSQESIPGGVTNKAFTNKVWKHADDPFLPLGGTSNRLPKATIADPYGSLRDLTKFDLDAKAGLRNYVFDDSSAGIPISCPRRTFNRLRTDVFTSNYLCSAMGGPLNPLNYGYDPSILETIARASDSSAGLDDNVNQLFARVFNWSRYTEDHFDFTNYDNLRDPDLIQRIDDSSNYIMMDISDQKPIAINPPAVHALNPATCFGEAGGININCTADHENNISVNGNSGTNTPGNDITRLYGFDSLSVTAQFFAFADHNSMPIRRVVMDWNDGRASNSQIASNGRYKNRKPFCSDQEDAGGVGECVFVGSDSPTGMTCQVNKDCEDAFLLGGVRCDTSMRNFGNSPRACEEGHFEYVHTYTCTPADHARTNQGKTVNDVSNTQLRNILLNTHGLDPAQPVCIYKPRVHVKDNWGWCNASDAIRIDDGRSLNEKLNDVANGTHDGSGGGPDNCQLFLQVPWTSFRGEVVVVGQRI